MAYGKELILDLHECDPSTFNRASLTMFFRELCELIDMEPELLCFWDDVGLPLEECQTQPHTKGTTAVQFILTSNITVHTLDILKKVFVNVFTCKDFEPQAAIDFTAKWFRGKVAASHVVERL